MALLTTPQRIWLRTIALAALLVALTGCTPPDQGRVIRDIVLDSDGLLVEIDSGENYTYEETSNDERQLTQLGQATEACLDDGTCIRIVDGRRIDESSDQWETSNTVWQIEPNATWWNHEYNNGWYEPVVELFDVVVLPDQTVAVASGQLPIITRSSNGAWSPTVADLRTVPNPLILIPAIAVMLLVSTLAIGGHHGTRFARIAIVLLLPGVLLFTAVTLHGNGSAGALLYLGFAVVVLAPLAPVASGLTIESLRRATHEPGLLRLINVGFAIVTTSTIAACIGVYLLWSNNVLSWTLANVLWAISIAAAIAVLVLASKLVAPKRATLTQFMPPAITTPMTLPMAIFVGYILGVAITIVAVVVSVIFAPVMISSGLGLVLWLGVGGWICSTFAAKVPYESTTYSAPNQPSRTR